MLAGKVFRVTTDFGNAAGEFHFLAGDSAEKALLFSKGDAMFGNGGGEFHDGGVFFGKLSDDFSELAAPIRKVGVDFLKKYAPVYKIHGLSMKNSVQLAKLPIPIAKLSAPVRGFSANHQRKSA